MKTEQEIIEASLNHSLKVNGLGAVVTDHHLSARTIVDFEAGAKWMRETEKPLMLKSLSMDYGLFTQIKNNCSHNNDIVCDTLINPNSEADFFHNSVTMEKINSSKAVDLFIRLIKQGYKISFKDGKGSTDLIKIFSPPIYDRLYKLTTQERDEKTI